MHDFVVKWLYVSFWVKPSWKVTCVNTEETIMEGHMHEQCPLYTSVPFVMFEGGVVWWWCQVAVSLTVSVLWFHVITRVVCVCACVCVL